MIKKTITTYTSDNYVCIGKKDIGFNVYPNPTIRQNHATYFEVRIAKYQIRFSDCFSKQFDGQVVKKGEQAMLPMRAITMTPMSYKQPHTNNLMSK